MPSEEINLVATLYPKPERAEELATLLAEVTRKVHTNEPDTLTYYAFSTKDKGEIVVVERNQAAVQAHVKSAYFQEFAAKVPELVTKPMEIKMGSQLASSERVSRI